ncbi:MAG: biopolymer transporter ExbD [Methylohalobius sp.]|nr:biopolymer transporter ExbD [Methylohalobius sp.]
MNFRSKAKDQVELNLVPLVDVVLTLLIFFMLTASFEHLGGLKVQLPQASAQRQEDVKGVEIAIDAEGRYYVNQHELVNARIETLKQAIAKTIEQGSRPVVVIAADRKTPHEFVVRALDALRQLGLKHIAFATQNADGEE